MQFIDNSQGKIVLQGDWVLDNARAIESELSGLVGRVDTITAQIGKLDVSGAAFLLELTGRLNYSLAQIGNLTARQRELLALVEKAPEIDSDTPEKRGSVVQSIIDLGRATFEARQSVLDLVRFIGETSVWISASFLKPGSFRFASLARHVRETGVNAIPIVALIAFLISIVLAYQGSNQLERFGAQVFTVNLVSISVLREMGVLLTAIMIAGRSGSAFTAEIGVMKVNEEIDAMRMTGVQPFGFLVVPRLLALMIVMPLLTFIADMMGLLGGGLVCKWVLNISPETYLDRMQDAVKLWDFWVGILKAPVFGFVIAVVGCMRGLQVTGSAESVGRLTTISVVQSIFLVLLLDAFFSILFTQIGI